MRRSDAELHEQVLRAIELEWGTADRELGIAVSGGVVTLSGYVDAEERARAVERVVARVPGVLAVVQTARVGTTGQLSQSDTAIAHRVVSHLTRIFGSPENRLVARVEHGWVTLEGEVDLAHERTDAEAIIRSLPGVQGVSNHLTVRPPETVARIRTKIDAALNRIPRPTVLQTPDPGSGGSVRVAKKGRALGDPKPST